MDNQHYRYCFSCEKWKTKQEINEIDLGGGNKTFNCNVCRKDLGDTIQIFRCSDHEEEILKVWGVLEGENKEKIFYKECPQAERLQTIWKVVKIAGIIGGVIILIIGAWFLIKWLMVNDKKQ